eukprot:TRINITY_DN31915_c0_g1_i1.p1 TRINITY_DN31915_c0_g1~~TRINITY_DN31915_c0_g1_i1.p1  ORF type:complete len:229 (+),score=36.77 TRINITY_DN31915_c0_g1_i1:120-806(+)
MTRLRLADLLQVGESDSAYGATKSLDLSPVATAVPLVFGGRGAARQASGFLDATAADGAPGVPPLLGSSGQRRAAFSSFIFEHGIHYHVPMHKAQSDSIYNPDPKRNAVFSPFNARQALAPGTGYWCSEGSHKKDSVVHWTGVLNHRRKAGGIKISWAYAPGLVRVRTSADLSHWDVAADWHKPPTNEVSFEEDIFFDRPRNVYSVKVEMKHPQKWEFYGINQATLVS